MFYSDGAKYVGKWKNYRRIGQGTYLSSDGTQYEGDFVNGVLKQEKWVLAW
jgi:hypothetical protein